MVKLYTDPLARIEITECPAASGCCKGVVTHIPATDTGDASRDSDGNLRVPKYDATGNGSLVKKRVATGNDTVYAVVDSSNNMTGTPSGGNGSYFGSNIGDESAVVAKSCGTRLASVSDLLVTRTKAMPDREVSQRTEMNEAAAERCDCFIQLRDLGDGNVHLRIVQAVPSSVAKQIRALLANTPESKRVLH
jgi:hypothetical protein